MSDAFGPLVSRGTVEQQVLALLQSVPASAQPLPLITWYLAAAERAIGVTPRAFPAPLTFRGGTDLEVYQADLLPTIIAVATPVGKPERYDIGTYAQWFSVQLGAIVKAEAEDDARALADGYGIAMAALIAKNGGLGPSPLDPEDRFAIKTNLETFPNVEFAVNATTSRNVLRAVVTFETCVQPVLTETPPPTYQTDPYQPPAVLPVVDAFDVTLAGVETLPD